ncbi:MAG: alcohol dehydrogenase catalytic domain-containing protein [Clostridia bacterium]|nr:alcohol dehydrogenase catalytic domain-containing protein [Clostridia bacterium]
MEAVAVDRWDTAMRRGEFPSLQLPHIPGGDICGIVDALGPDTETSLGIGERVVTYPAIPCGACEACQAGQVQRCRRIKWLGLDLPGGYAEYITVPTAIVRRAPATLPPEAAASLPMAFVTAYHALVDRGRLRPGDVVAISGATGGVGAAAVQLAHVLGASRVLALGSSEEKLQRLATLMPWLEVVAYGKGGDAATVMEAVQQQLAGTAIDVVIDQVGAPTYRWLAPLLGTGSRYVAVGAASGEKVAPLDLQLLLTREIDVMGALFGTPAELDTCLDLAANHHISPVVDAVYDLEAAAEAHRRLEAREHVGRIVLRVWRP